MKPPINIYQSLIALDNPKHRQHNMSSTAHALWHKIRVAPSRSPFIEFDMMEFIIVHFAYDKWEFKEEQLREIIADCISYFNKGNKEEIYNLMREKLGK